MLLKKQVLPLSFLATLLIFSGCVENDLRLPRQNYNTQQGESWQDQSVDDNESIDISDLDENLTETELGMNANEQKMPRVPFPVSEYNRLARVGKGTIEGTISVTDSFGKKIPGAATRLYLNPMTSYSNQWYTESYLGGNKMEKADSRLFNYLRFTASNSTGKFAFYGVPSGSYYLIGTVKCGTECGYDTAKSIRIANRVQISGNKVIKQDLSRAVD